MAKLSSREIFWNRISRTCFQDRVMPYAYWLSSIMDSNHREHSKVLEQSIVMIPAKQFVDLIGERDFVEKWRSLRKEIKSERIVVKQGKLILDGIWSSVATGFAFSNPNTSLSKPLSAQLKRTYLDICKNSKKSIYQVAKDTNRAYNRVHGDVKKLEEFGLISSYKTKLDGRNISFLSANTN